MSETAPTSGTAPPEVVQLVESFGRDRARVHGANYKERNLQQDYLLPLFRSLGWDPSRSREVREEFSLRVAKTHGSATTQSVDYAFLVNGQVKLFVEAKTPRIDVVSDVGAAFQARSYGWNRRLPVTVLTNFEVLSLYDTTIPPRKDEDPSIARVDTFKATDFVARWRDLAGLLSREAVAGGVLEKYVEETPARDTRRLVDDSFLEDMEGWRAVLAKEIVKRNDLTAADLNSAVQGFLDRIVFLRICEDRGLEDPRRLEGLLSSGDITARLRRYFDLADQKYNSGLFHFAEEKGRTGVPDKVAQRLRMDDAAVERIVRGLYNPRRPYNFAVIRPEILGQVYERFLGKVIRITNSGDRAKVEDKPEVKKAGGVYYTPSFVVDFIVRNTLEPLLQGRTPERVARTRILDPACGSGSFLISAFQYLLDWHLDRYLADGPRKRPDELVEIDRGRWVLSIPEKKRILQNSIFGVDIDFQAVEVTKLALCLKVLEDTPADTIEVNQRLFEKRALPELSSNVKCGNSLIGTDFARAGAGDGRVDDAAINPFDWNREFQDQMEDGGFDAVVGNPPYLNVDDVWGKGDPRLGYLKSHYPEIYRDKTDLYYYFLRRSTSLMKGRLGFIVSRAFLEAYKADLLRTWLSSNAGIRTIVDFQNEPIFPGVGITTAIVFLSREALREPPQFYTLTGPLDRGQDLEVQLAERSRFARLEVEPTQFGSKPWLFAHSDVEALLTKIDAAGTPVAEVLHVGQGMQTGANQAFGGLTRKDVEAWGLRPGQFFMRARNSDIHRYETLESGEYVMYVEDFSDFDRLPAGVRRHLEAHAAVLKGRAAYKRGNCEWWRFTWPLHREYLGRRKILTPYMASSNRFALDSENRFLSLTDTTVLFENGQPEDLRYILGLLNSALLTFRFRFLTKLKSGGVYEYFWNQVGQLPLRRIDFANTKEKGLHDQVVRLVQELIQGRVALRSAGGHERVVLERALDAADQELESVVRELYGIGDSEWSKLKPRKAANP